MGISMLKVPGRRRRLPHAVDVRLTVSRVADGAVEVTITGPGQAKAQRKRTTVAQRAESTALRLPKAARKNKP
jgi:hypothetical protein